MRKKNERYNKTLFNSCLAMPLYLLSLAILKIIGWKIDNDISRHYRKAVIVGAPHTTNWDFFFAMLFFFGMRMRHLYVLGKESLIKPPLGFIMLWLGVLPVNRSIAKNSVAKAIEILNRAENMFIALTPEGTRKDVAEWRTGFYHIAQGANVPILMAYIDYKKRCIGFIAEFTPIGNIDADIAAIQLAYADKLGKNIK